MDRIAEAVKSVVAQRARGTTDQWQAFWLVFIIYFAGTLLAFLAIVLGD